MEMGENGQQNFQKVDDVDINASATNESQNNEAEEINDKPIIKHESEIESSQAAIDTEKDSLQSAKSATVKSSLLTESQTDADKLSKVCTKEDSVTKTNDSFD